MVGSPNDNIVEAIVVHIPRAVQRSAEQIAFLLPNHLPDRCAPRPSRSPQIQPCPAFAVRAAFIRAYQDIGVAVAIYPACPSHSPTHTHPLFIDTGIQFPSRHDLQR